jgi:ABC-type amino acid transport substrate-binding protein
VRLLEAAIVGIACALITTAVLRTGNWAGTQELALASQPAFDRVMKTRKIRCAYSRVAGYFDIIDPTRSVTRGIAHDIAEQMGRILNLDIEWGDEVAPADVASRLTDGRDDMMCIPLWPSGKQAAALDYTAPIDYMPVYAYVRADDKRFDGDLSKANAQTIAIPVIEDGVTKIIADEDFPQANQFALTVDADGPHLLLAVSTKRADIAISDAFSGEDFMKNSPGTLRPVANVGPVRVFGESLAVAKGETKLRDMVNVALTQMQQSGFIRATLDKYLGDHKGEYFYVGKKWE